MAFLTTAALLAGGAALARGTGAALQARAIKKAQEPYQERLSDLEEMQRRGQLGLTGEEEALLLRRTADPGRALAAQRLEQQQALSSGALGSGEVLSQLTQQAEAERAALDRAQQAAAEADIQKKRSQEAEIQGLAQQLAQMEAQRKAQLIGGITGAVSQGLGSVSQAYALNEMINRPSAEGVEIGTASREARDIYNISLGNDSFTSTPRFNLPRGGR
jgi:hypothetical protein